MHEHGGKTSEGFVDKLTILASLQLGPGQVVVDAGCGNGYMAKEFAKLVGKGGKVYAIDAHEESIEQLGREAEGGVIKAVLGDVSERMDMADASVGLVYLSMVFHGFTAEQREGFLGEVRRILQPNGVLAVLEFKKVDSPMGPPMDIRYGPEELRAAVDGLESLACVDVGDYLYLQRFVKVSA